NAAGESFRGDFGDPAQRWQVSFAPSGPVLNVPAGYTVSGHSVVDNRWYDPFPDELVIDHCDDPAALAAVPVRGDLVLHELAGCPALAFPQLTDIGGNLIIDGNDGDLAVDLGDGSVGEAIDASSTDGDLTIDVGSVGEAIDASSTDGDLTI